MPCGQQPTRSGLGILNSSVLPRTGEVGLEFLSSWLGWNYEMEGEEACISESLWWRCFGLSGSLAEACLPAWGSESRMTTWLALWVDPAIQFFQFEEPGVGMVVRVELNR